jgi:hypothetical protein
MVAAGLPPVNTTTFCVSRKCSVSIRSLPNGSLLDMNEGGDKRIPRAKVDIAKREQQIVALKLRGITAPESARVIGISRRVLAS